MRMIEEKEQKLIELLERQGISKKNYFFSWLITYLFIIIPPIFVIFYLSIFSCAFINIYIKYYFICN